MENEKVIALLHEFSLVNNISRKQYWQFLVNCTAAGDPIQKIGVNISMKICE